MKNSKFWLVIFLMGILAFSFSCAKKTIRSDAGSYIPPAGETKPGEVGPRERPEAKLEAVSPERGAELESEKKLKEENLREEALRDRTLQEETARRETQAREAARRETEAREAARKAAQLEPVYFDYDQWSIREDQKDIMLKNAEWLKANPRVEVRVEGHCDERGTAEYNLALGQKRAEAGKAYLEGLGINSQRISALSYGKERPFDPGHNEDAWAKNRRLDFVPIR